MWRKKGCRQRSLGYWNAAFPGLPKRLQTAQKLLLESQQGSMKIDHVTGALRSLHRFLSVSREIGKSLLVYKSASGFGPKPHCWCVKKHLDLCVMSEHPLALFFALCCASLIQFKAFFGQILTDSETEKKPRPSSFICVAHFIYEATCFTLKSIESKFKRTQLGRKIQ